MHDGTYAGNSIILSNGSDSEFNGKVYLLRKINHYKFIQFISKAYNPEI